MSRRIFVSFVAIAALALITLPARANSNSNATIKATFDVTATTKVGSTTLEPGQYEVQVEGTQAKFLRGRKTVAEVPCTVKELSSKAQQTGFQVDNGQITEIDISGRTQAIAFSASASSGN
jgi:hypothetical protein